MSCPQNQACHCKHFHGSVTLHGSLPPRLMGKEPHWAQASQLALLQHPHCLQPRVSSTDVWQGNGLRHGEGGREPWAESGVGLCPLSGTVQQWALPFEAVGLVCWDQHLPTLLPSPVTEAGKHCLTPLQLWVQMQLGSVLLLSRDIRKTQWAEALGASWTSWGTLATQHGPAVGLRPAKALGPESHSWRSASPFFQ